MGLCSKTYTVTGEGGTKCSCKSINKGMGNDPISTFLFKKSGSTINRGMRAKNNTNQERTGFTYLYINRQIQEDNIHTILLDSQI